MVMSVMVKVIVESVGRVRVPKRMNGGHFPFKNVCCRFWTFIGFFLDMIPKKLQYNFPKMRGGGGVEGRLELFRKFIRFDVATLSLIGQ